MPANTRPCWLPYLGTHTGIKSYICLQFDCTESDPKALHSICQKRKFCVNISGLLSHRGFWICVSLCVCGWGGYFEPSHPLNPPSHTLIERFEALELDSSRRAGELFSHALPHLPLTFSCLIYSQTCLKHLLSQ